MNWGYCIELTPTVMVEPRSSSSLKDHVRAKDDLEEVVGHEQSLGIVGRSVLHEAWAGPCHNEHVDQTEDHIDDQAVGQQVAVQPSVPLFPKSVVEIKHDFHSVVDLTPRDTSSDYLLIMHL